MKIICKQCRQEFELPESEIQFYKSKGLSLPKRCKNCRQQNKEKKLNQGITVIQREKDKPSVPIWIFIIVILIFTAIIAVILQNQKQRSESSVLSEEISLADETEPASESAVSPTETIADTAVPGTETTVPPEETKEETAPHTEKPEVTYVLNTYRKKFHKPTCASVSEMNPKNREYFYGTRDEAVAQGYSPCGNCNP